MKWFELCKNLINTWEQFEVAFLNKFWSRDVQRGIKHRIENEQYRPGGKLSRAEYFIERVLILRAITPPLTDEEIVTILSEHFSELIQDARHVQNINSVNEFELLLQREDLKDHHRRPKNHNQPRPDTPNRTNNHHNYNQQQSSNYQNKSYPPRSPNQHNNYPRRPSGYNNNSYNNYRPEYRQPPRQDYQRPPPRNENSYHPYKQFKKEDRNYPSREHQQVCTAIIERRNQPTDNIATTSTNPNSLNQ